MTSIGLDFPLNVLFKGDYDYGISLAIAGKLKLLILTWASIDDGDIVAFGTSNDVFGDRRNEFFFIKC